MESTTDRLTERYGLPKYAGYRMEKADFLRWESDDNYVYEFNNGLLEPTTSMRQDENYLFTNLENCFTGTDYYKNGYRLRPEMDVWVGEKQMRRPDISFFSADQMSLMAIGKNVVPEFVVELASESDNELKSLTKRHEYFAAGVRVIWWVYPAFGEVYVYTSPKTVTIVTDADLLSAAPALPDLHLTVEELFRR